MYSIIFTQFLQSNRAECSVCGRFPTDQNAYLWVCLHDDCLKTLCCFEDDERLDHGIAHFQVSLSRHYNSLFLSKIYQSQWFTFLSWINRSQVEFLDYLIIEKWTLTCKNHPLRVIQPNLASELKFHLNLVSEIFGFMNYRVWSLQQRCQSSEFTSSNWTPSVFFITWFFPRIICSMPRSLKFWSMDQGDCVPR